MKKLVPVVLVSALLVACTQDPSASSSGEARVVGEILGSEISEVRLNGAPPRLEDGWSNDADPNELPFEVAPDGTFESSLKLEKPSFYRLTAGERTVELFLAPGDVSRVVFRADAEREAEGEAGGEGRPEVEFSGDRATLNQFTVRLDALLQGARQEFDQNAREIFSLDPAGLENWVAEGRQELLDEHEAFVASQADVPQAYIERTRDDIVHWFKRVQILYPSVHHELTGSPAGVAASYLEEVAGDSFEQPGSLSSLFYVRFLDEYVNLASAGDLKYSPRNLPREKLLSRYEAIDRLPAPPEVKNYLLEEMFRNFRISYGPADWGPALASLTERDPGNPVALAVQPLYEQDMARRDEPDEIRIYRRVDGIELEAHLFYPEGLAPGGGAPEDRRSAYLFFHGGGWASGTPEWGYESCQRLAAQGMVAISFEYRLADVHGTGLFASVEDVQAAVRWVRSLAGQGEEGLPIDPDRVVAAGFSAGGHLAAGAAILEIIGPSEPSPRPNALVIHSSSYNLTKSRFFDAMTGGRAEEVSLIHQVYSGLVPTILFHGRYDHLAPLGEFQEFVDRMKTLDNDFEHHLFDVGHFFRNAEARTKVHELTNDFLARRGFLPD